MNLSDRLNAVERDAVTEALLAHGGSRIRAAEALGRSRTWVFEIIRRHGITIPPSPARWYDRRCTVCNKPGHRVNFHRPSVDFHRSRRST